MKYIALAIALNLISKGSTKADAIKSATEQTNENVRTYLEETL